MTAVLQRVKRASVAADGAESGKIQKGLMILLGVRCGDDATDARLLAEKIAKLRIFSDECGKMNLSLLDVGGEALVISNFTLGANYAHGNRPDYLDAARPDVAEPLYRSFISALRECAVPVENGVFGADMQIDMIADGPVTIVMESSVLRKGKKG